MTEDATATIEALRAENAALCEEIADEIAAGDHDAGGAGGLEKVASCM